LLCTYVGDTPGENTALLQQFVACRIYLQHILRNSHLHMYITTNENSHNNKKNLGHGTQY